MLFVGEIVLNSVPQPNKMKKNPLLSESEIGIISAAVVIATLKFSKKK